MMHVDDNLGWSERPGDIRLGVRHEAGGQETILHAFSTCSQSMNEYLNADASMKLTPHHGHMAETSRLVPTGISGTPRIFGYTKRALFFPQAFLVEPLPRNVEQTLREGFHDSSNKSASPLRLFKRIGATILFCNSC